METRRIGSLSVSAVGLGCNGFGARLDAAASAAVIQTAIEGGITLFDTADIYGEGDSEVFLGRALKGRRDAVVIATKFGFATTANKRGAHPDYVRLAVEDSLRRLATDRIDLYQLHRPDPAVPIADTLGALDDLVKVGKVLEVGCSHFTADQIERAQEASRPGNAQFVSVQNQFSLLHRAPEKGVLPTCERLGLALIPYFPLARGLLTGQYRKGRRFPARSRLIESPGSADELSEARLDWVEALAQFAESHGQTLLSLAFGWLLSHRPVASVIAGASTSEQVLANIAAAEWHLTEAEMSSVPAFAACAQDDNTI